MESMVPKTESRPLPEDHRGAFQGAALEMAVRLWIPDARPSSSAPDRGAVTPPGLLELIADTVASHNGRTQTSEGRVHIFGLDSPADALVIARRLQLCIGGFRRRSAVVTVSASIAIDLATVAQIQQQTSSENDNAASIHPMHLSHDLASLLKLTRPAQVVLTHDFYQRVGQMSGLPLRPFPGRFGVYEYLWTDESKLEQLQFDPHLALEVMTAPTATRESTATAVNIAEGKSAPAMEASEVLPSNLQIGAARPTGFLQSRVMLMSIAAAMGLLIAGGGVIAYKSHSRQQDVGPAPIKSEPIHSMAPQAQLPVSAPQNAQPAQASSAAPSADAATSVPTEPGKPQKRDRTVPSPSPAVAKTSGDCSDLVTLEQLAENDRQHGNLKDARRRFQRVLSCDPSNRAARIGLDKTLTAMSGR